MLRRPEKAFRASSARQIRSRQRTANIICGTIRGKLAVFLPDKQTPEIVFDVYLSTLPAYDRGQLQLGVPVQDYEELVKRIEDYIS